MEQRVALQIAIVASIVTISTFFIFSAFRRKQDEEFITKEEFVKETNIITETIETSNDTILKEKETIQKTSISATNIGQEAATNATAKYKEGKFLESIELYTLALSQILENPSADQTKLKVLYSNRSAAYEKLNDYKHMLQDASSALTYDSKHPKAYLRSAKAKAALGDGNGALVDYFCLLVLMEEKGDKGDDTLGVTITQLHEEIIAKETRDALENRQAQGSKIARHLPDTCFVTSYLMSFHKSDDESKVQAQHDSQHYTKELEAMQVLLGEESSAKQHGELLTLRGLAYKKEKQFDDASEDFNKAITLLDMKDSPESYYTANLEAGTLYHLRGNFAKAQECFEAARKVKPYSILAAIRLGGVCIDLGELKEAREWIEKALTYKPKSATALYHRAQLHSLTDLTEGSGPGVNASLEDLKECASIAPDFTMAHVLIGVTYTRMGELEKAISNLTKACELDPKMPDVYNYLGQTYLQMLQVPGAQVDLGNIEALFQKAIEVDPTYAVAYINYGNVLLQKGIEYTSDAVKLLEKAVKQCPKSKLARSQLAQVYVAMQEFDRAIEQIDAAMDYTNTKEEIQELYAIRVTADTHQKARRRLAGL